MRDAADYALARAATDPNLDDDVFVMVSRAIDGRNPLTGESEPLPVLYWVAPDADGEVALWRGTGEDDPQCQPVAYRFALDADDPILWPALLRGMDITTTPDGETR